MRTSIVTQVWRRLSVILALLCCFSLLPETVHGQESRMYKIQHRLVSEFEPMVRALLGKRGSMTMSPDLRLIIVNDEQDNLAAIDSLVAAYDRPQRQIKVTVQLVIGYMAEDSLPLPENLIFLQTLIDEQNYKFNAFEVLDQGVIMMDDGSRTALSLANNVYALSFSVAGTVEPEKMLKFRGFELNLNERSLRGTSQRTLLATEFSLKDGLIEMLTAAKQGIEEHTLMVFIEAILL